jgi:hypothetical protein
VQEPDWTATKGIDFYGISNAEVLKLEFFHNGALGLDAELGEIVIEVSDVRKAKLQDADSGFLEIEILFVPEF